MNGNLWRCVITTMDHIIMEYSFRMDMCIRMEIAR